MGDFIEKGVKCGKIQSMVALQAASRAIQSGSIGGIKRKREDVSTVTYQQGGPSHRYSNYPAHTAYAPYQARNACVYTPIAEPYAQLFERLRTARVLQPVEGRLPDLIPRNFDGNKRCAYHLRIQGHNTEDSYGLKNRIESLIKRGVIKCNPAPLNPKSGLGPKSNGIVAPIQLKHQRGTNRLGYESATGRVHQGQSNTVFVPKRSFDQAGDDHIVEGIGNLFVAMAGEEEEINLSKLTVRDAKPREILNN
ncbi:hypothetical protein H5410_021458 [Solanum commersonii]|uniref:Uncharacterized protein n=1 Tax=Solanum commersonii TaxID=4109 RepID=A0A9J5ZBE6_SOLCO|nr:hypothetical protein H5410_021458 [Solanum commersonii]